MHALQAVLTYVLAIYLVILVGRWIFDLLRAFARDWKPTGILLVLAEGLVYPVTDPPLRFLRRFIPPLRLGGGRVALDLSFMVLFFVVLILLEVAVPRL